MDELELTTDRDIFFDFCMWDYQPLVPHENKFRSVNLLFHSFEAAGLDKRAFHLVRAIREGIGPSRTVWGVKQLGGQMFWEFYFYDYMRRERELSVTKLLEIIKPFVSCDLAVNENIFYFMFSIDIHENILSGSSELKEIHLYIGNPGSTVSSGICYSLTNQGSRLENLYFFFDGKKQLEDIIAKMVCSAHIDTAVIAQDQILWPEMKDCKVIVVANKQDNDSIYFSGINVEQFIFFLKRMGYRHELISFVEENKSNLNHLQYDVGFDYRMDGNELLVIKSGYYGFF